jgi:uncharacterized membrane protein
MSPSARRLQQLALASYLLLIALVVLWEGWLAPAPLAPPGFWLTIKGVLLLAPLFGLLRDKPRSYLWASLLVMLYFTEGTMLLYLHRAEDFALHNVLPYALLETLLTLVFIASAGFYVRAIRTAGAEL